MHARPAKYRTRTQATTHARRRDLVAIPTNCSHIPSCDRKHGNGVQPLIVPPATHNPSQSPITPNLSSPPRPTCPAYRSQGAQQTAQAHQSPDSLRNPCNPLQSTAILDRSAIPAQFMNIRPAKYRTRTYTAPTSPCATENGVKPAYTMHPCNHSQSFTIRDLHAIPRQFVNTRPAIYRTRAPTRTVRRPIAPGLHHYPGLHWDCDPPAIGAARS